jgi:hypothetical protein
LANPEIVMAELQRKREPTQDTGILDRNLARIKVQLANREKQKTRAWKAFEITGDEASFKESISWLQKEVEGLRREESRLQQEVAANAQSRPDSEDIVKACELVRQNLKGLSAEDKRQAMDALQVKVWVDGNAIEVEGSIPLPDVSIASRSVT